MSEDESVTSELKILLVDDEVNITKALRRLLMEEDQYDIHIANSGADALEVLADEPGIGVIVSDQRMPEMTGVEFLQQARDIVPDAVRILLTGYADIEASISAINEGAVFRYLTKPWDDEKLLQSIGEAAKNYWLVAENKRLNKLVLKQKDELEQWNSRLKQRVLDQTSQIRAKGLELASSNKQLRGSFQETIESLAGLIEMRDQKAPGHSRNVAKLVMAIGRHLKLADDEITKFYSAALLHDIGKISIPDTLLEKPLSRLSEAEFKEYRTHSIRGQAAIDMVPTLQDIGVLIRHHHERFDGRGFPDQLKGNDIPLGARIIAVADMFERRLLEFKKDDAFNSTLKELEAEWGRTLDPTLKLALEIAGKEVYSYFELSATQTVAKVSPEGLEIGMQLLHDIFSGTGILLLKRGTIFDEHAIGAVRRCFMVDPFVQDISVIMPSK